MKKIIDLLEKIFKIADNDEPDESHGYPLIKTLAGEAIDLLNQQAETEVRHPIGSDNKVNHKRSYCYSCGTTVRDQKYCHGCGRKLKWPACSDCQKPAEQPEAGDFTKSMRKTIKVEQESAIEFFNNPLAPEKIEGQAIAFADATKVLCSILTRACVLLDNAESINAELLFSLKTIAKTEGATVGNLRAVAVAALDKAKGGE